MKKLLVILCMALSLVACSEEKSDKPVVKIGVIMSFTGAEPEGANNAKNALLFVRDKKLKTDIKYDLIFEDSAGEIAKGLNAAKKLVSYDNVDVVFSNISGVSKAIAPYLAENQVVHIAFSSDKETAQGDTNFVFWISADEYARKMLGLLQENKYKNVAVVVNSDATSIQRYNALEKLVKGTGIKLQKNEIIPGTRDFKILVDKIVKNKPDTVILLSPLPELDIFAKQFRNANTDIMITSMDFINYSADKKLFENSVYVSTGDGDKQIVQEIMDAIHTKNPFALAYMYDGLTLVDSVINNHYRTTKSLLKHKDLANEIIKVGSFNGAVGNVVIGADGVINPQAVIKQIENGEPVIMK